MVLSLIEKIRKHKKEKKFLENPPQQLKIPRIEEIEKTTTNSILQDAETTTIEITENTTEFPEMTTFLPDFTTNSEMEDYDYLTEEYFESVTEISV